MRRRSKRYLLFVAFVLFLSSYIASSLLFAYFRKVYLPEFFNVYRKLIFPDDISCYRTSEFSTNYIYAPNSIFFYQTACRRTIRLHEACSIEAAARLHPNKNVYIIILNEISPHDAVIKQVERYSNVKVSRINIESFVNGTPFNDLYDIIYKVKRRHKVMSDLLKIITLFKYGGTALNLDITVTKSLSKLGKHWFVKDGGSIFPMLNLSNDLIGRAAAYMIMRLQDL
nr:lactosylceramide 4-alpha-galactosyltransferase-like isoform X1 [Danaus plexippus plexippus]